MPQSNGILVMNRKAGGRLYDPEWPDHSVFVPPQLIQKYELPAGVRLTGPSRKNRRGLALADVETIGGIAPADFLTRTPFNRLIAIDPCERFFLGKSGEISMRAVDLIAPIGKGTRGMIISPPKAGKTLMLEQIAQAIRVSSPDVRIIALLIDERPEEVTHLRRNLGAEVFASSSDQSTSQHAELAELILAHARSELECGRDIVVLVDSLTRMGRSYNMNTRRGSGRTLSGGLDASALEIPRRFFGLARNIEGGGSITVLATALIDTGSRMDQLIVEEFKGTGNSEIVLDRELAYAYVFPAINITASGTRKEHLLYSGDEMRLIIQLRRRLSGRNSLDAMRTLLKMLEQTSSNEELLQSLS
jgi:transcription termination factor Rho